MGRGGVWELAVPLGGDGESQCFDVFGRLSAPVKGQRQFVSEPDGIPISMPGA